MTYILIGLIVVLSVALLTAHDRLSKIKFALHLDQRTAWFDVYNKAYTLWEADFMRRMEKKDSQA